MKVRISFWALPIGELGLLSRSRHEVLNCFRSVHQSRLGNTNMLMATGRYSHFSADSTIMLRDSKDNPKPEAITRRSISPASTSPSLTSTLLPARYASAQIQHIKNRLHPSEATILPMKPLNVFQLSSSSKRGRLLR